MSQFAAADSLALSAKQIGSQTKHMKLSEWAKLQGVSYRTAWRWFKSGGLPVPVLVEHRDRLVRFGSEYIESALSSAHRKVLVMEQKELNDDLVQDMIDVLTSFCARLYGSMKQEVTNGIFVHKL